MFPLQIIGTMPFGKEKKREHIGAKYQIFFALSLFYFFIDTFKTMRFCFLLSMGLREALILSMGGAQKGE